MSIFGNRTQDYHRYLILIAANNESDAIRLYENTQTKHRYNADTWFEVKREESDCDRASIIMED